MAPDDPRRRRKPLCSLCKKPITGKVYFQAGIPILPVHKNCRVIIKRLKDGGI